MYRKVGEDGFGVIFAVFKLSQPEEHTACKVELSNRNMEDKILKLEGQVMHLLNQTGTQYCAKYLKERTEKNYRYLIMSLLGAIS